MKRVPACLSASLVVAVVTLCGCNSQGTAEVAKHDSPDAAFAAAKSAASNGDWKGIMACMTSEAQDQLAGGAVMMAAFVPMMASMGGDEAKKAEAEAIGKELEAVLKKHGITEEAMGQAPEPTAEPDFSKILGPVADKGALVADLFALVAKVDEGGDPIAMFAKATLKDVSTDGDSAVGTLVTEDGEQPLQFKMVDGGWLMDKDPNGPGGGPGPGEGGPPPGP